MLRDVLWIRVWWLGILEPRVVTRCFRRQNMRVNEKVGGCLMVTINRGVWG